MDYESIAFDHSAIYAIPNCKEFINIIGNLSPSTGRPPPASAIPSDGRPFALVPRGHEARSGGPAPPLGLAGRLGFAIFTSSAL